MFIYLFFQKVRNVHNVLGETLNPPAGWQRWLLLLTDKLNRKDNTLGLLMNDSSLYNNLNATTANAASLLEDLKSHPKRYVHFSLFGKKDK
jgi:hypothetical protein